MRLPVKLVMSVVFLVVIQTASIATHGQESQKTLPYRFLIPEGYVGWIRLDFEVPDTPPLLTDGGFYILKFSESGRLQTSSRDIVNVNSLRNEFYYYSTEGKYQLKRAGPLETRMVEGEFSGPGSGHMAPVPRPYRYIFIGPYDVFAIHQATDQRLAPHEPDGYPKVGAENWLSREDLIRMKIRQP